MRFHDGGPNLPHRLLEAADEGRVVYFCGAGVSRARAGLPDFTGLVRRVVSDLRPLPGGMVSRLLAAEDALRQATPPIDLPPGVPGLVSADRLFGHLEDEFPRRQPWMPPWHRRCGPRLGSTSLPTGSSFALAAVRGRTRLVTTNFDLLLEEASAGGLRVFSAQRPPAGFRRRCEAARLGQEGLLRSRGRRFRVVHRQLRGRLRGRWLGRTVHASHPRAQHRRLRGLRRRRSAHAIPPRGARSDGGRANRRLRLPVGGSRARSLACPRRDGDPLQRRE